MSGSFGPVRAATRLKTCRSSSYYPPPDNHLAAASGGNVALVVALAMLLGWLAGLPDPLRLGLAAIASAAFPITPARWIDGPAPASGT